MAQVRAAQQNYDEAIALYQKAIKILPMPEYAAALGEVFERIGQHSKRANSMHWSNTLENSTSSTNLYTIASSPTSTPTATSRRRKV